MIEVLYEDNDLMIVDKPRHLVVCAPRHRGGTRRIKTLQDKLCEQLGITVMPAHRLDGATRGLVVFAKSSYIEQALFDAFRKRRVEKRYILAVSGQVSFKKLQCDLRLSVIHDNGHKRAVVAKRSQHGSRDSKAASTNFRVLEHRKTDGITILEARPHTGRFHQIRAHIASLRHPILGDRLYTPVDVKPAHTTLHLTAMAMAFQHPRTKQTIATTLSYEALALFEPLSRDPRQSFLDTYQSQ